MSASAGDPLAIGVRELEEIAALGWRPAELHRLGSWQLRAAAGFTGRANSALAVGDPGAPVPVAIDSVVAWYRDRGLPPRFMLPLPDAAELDQSLAALGWTLGDDVRVLVRTLDPVPAEGDCAGPGDSEPRVRIDRSADSEWTAAYHYRGSELPDSARTVLDRGDLLAFASVRDPAGRVVAIARGSLDQGWLGVTAVEVAPSERRRGLGKAVLLALSRWAARHGAQACYLQVAAENSAALALYRGLGFIDHHTYRYRILR